MLTTRLLFAASLLVSSLALGCGSDVIRTPGDDGDGGGGGDGGAGSVGVGSGPSSGAGASGSSGSGSGSSGSGSSGSGSGSGSSSSGSGSGSSGSGSGSSGSGGVVCPSDGDPCSSCAATACPDEWCACAGEPECAPLLDCWDGCTTEACYQDCMSAHPNGVSAAVLTNSCASSACSACPQGWEPLDPCSECLFSSCDDEMNACYAQPACLELWTCFGECGPVDLTCQQTCYAMWGEGVPALQTALECTDSQCPACG